MGECGVRRSGLALLLCLEACAPRAESGRTPGRLPGWARSPFASGLGCTGFIVPVAGSGVSTAGS